MLISKLLIFSRLGCHSVEILLALNQQFQRNTSVGNVIMCLQSGCLWKLCLSSVLNCLTDMSLSVCLEQGHCDSSGYKSENKITLDVEVNHNALAEYPLVGAQSYYKPGFFIMQRNQYILLKVILWIGLTYVFLLLNATNMRALLYDH